MTLSELAKRLSLKHKGDSKKEISYIRDIERLSKPEDFDESAIYYIENRKTLKKYPFAKNKITTLIPEPLAEHFEDAVIAPQDSVRIYFIKLLETFSLAPSLPSGISPHASVHESAKVAPSATLMPQAVVMQEAEIGESVVIYPNVTIEPGARIGKNTALHPGVVIGYNCILGENCIIYGGTVIGADGFGYHDHQEKRYKIPQISHVEIGDHVEIGSNCSIDRGTIEPTTIEEYTKIDNQVQIGHNCRVGRYVFIAGNAGISGSVNIGDRAVIAGQAGLADHVNIGESSVVMGLTGIHMDTKPKTAYFGIPGRPARESHRINGALPHLPELLKRLRALEEKTNGKSDGD